MYADVNKNVLSLALKTPRLSEGSRISKGRAFHKVGPDMEKLRGPNSIVFEREMTNSGRAPRKVLRAPIEDAVVNISER